MELHPLPYYKWYWQQFRLSRKVKRMTYIERGLYRDLLDEQWEKGSVSGNIEDMADICGCPVDIMASAWQVLNKCFTLVNGRYINETLEQQRTEKDNLRITLSENGRRGGVAKAQRNQEESGKCQASAKQSLANSGSLSREEEIRLEEISLPNGNSPRKERGANVPYRAMQDIYNALCGDLIHSSALSEKTKRNMAQTFKMLNRDMSKVEALVRKAAATKYFTGDNDRGWKADIEYVFRPDKAEKIISGAFERESDVDRKMREMGLGK